MEDAQIEKIKGVLDRLRPFIQQDGGDVEFVGMNGDIVQVRMVGACHGCPSSMYTLKMGLEAQIREEVPEVAEVEAV